MPNLADKLKRSCDGRNATDFADCAMIQVAHLMKKDRRGSAPLAHATRHWLFGHRR